MVLAGGALIREEHLYVSLTVVQFCKMLLLLFFSACLLLQGSALHKKEAVEYLVNYGYINPKVLQTNSQIPKKEFETALIGFQKFVGLKQTGKLDSETCTMMQKPRCGVKDKFEFEEDGQNSDRNRSTAWSREELTYRVLRYARHLHYGAVNEVFKQALLTWASVTNLHFQQIYELADINIAFVGMNSSSSHLFRSGVYAHAFLPPTGAIYFSQDWNWTIREPAGVDLFLVAVHEFGHALGLQHSTSNKSIMYPYLQMGGFNGNFSLLEEDVQNIQSLYGPRRSHPPTICPNSSFDAIFEYPAGVIYVLQGEYYWKVIQDGIASGYPRLISHRWPELPGNIDAATATNTGTYFFKEDRYWVYDHSCQYAYEPSYISVGWPGIPNDVDGATWDGHSIFYFFKGDLYWKYDLSQSPKVSTSYPKPTTTNWGGVEGLFDDVLYVNSGYIYFFTTNRTYYRYNCATALIDYGHPSQPNFPRSTGHWWFHCDEEDVEENVTSSVSSTSTIVNGTTAVSTTVEESAETTTSDLTTSITTTESGITAVEENVTSSILSTSAIVTDTTALSTAVKESAENTTSNLTSSISTTESGITGAEENVTSSILSTSAIVTDTTALSTAVKESAENTTSNLTSSITTTESGITGAEENVTSSILSTSAIVTDTTALSTTVKESAENTTSNLTSSITTTESGITGAEENVTSSMLPSTSTIEETPPASGRELSYDAETFTRSGKLLAIQTNMASDIAACPVFSSALAIVMLLALR